MICINQMDQIKILTELNIISSSLPVAEDDIANDASQNLQRHIISLSPSDHKLAMLISGRDGKIFSFQLQKTESSCLGANCGIPEWTNRNGSLQYSHKMASFQIPDISTVRIGS
jgi:hypothetical protein